MGKIMTLQPQIDPIALADKGRNIVLTILTLIGFFVALVAIFPYRSGNTAALTGLLYMGFVVACTIISLLILRCQTSIGKQHWTSNGMRVELIAPPALIWSELGALSLLAFSSIVGIIVQVLGPRGAWMIPFGLSTMGVIGLYYLFPVLRPGCGTRLRISLSNNGVELTRINGRKDTIPWQAHPRLTGVYQGHAVIAIKDHEDLRYPIGYLPLSMRQLERLLSTFSRSTRLRTKLSGPEALSTVLAILEPTEEELTDDSWTWSR